MGRKPCCSKEGLNRGAWTAEEDQILSDCIKAHGEGRWRDLPKKAGLKRCGKSCRLRWLNYLRPDIKRGNISSDEEELIIRLHKLLGNRWALIAGRLHGRTDNEIKNYWNTILAKKTVTRTFGQKTKRPSKPNNMVQCLSKPVLAAPQPTNPNPVGLGSTLESTMEWGQVELSHTFQCLVTDKDYNIDMFADLELGFDIGEEVDWANLLSTTNMLSSASPSCSLDHQPEQFLDCCMEEQLWIG